MFVAICQPALHAEDSASAKHDEKKQGQDESRAGLRYGNQDAGALREVL
jgi:hypothetical protein